MPTDNNIENNVKDINDGVYGKKMNDKAVGYRKGAVVGLIAGVLTGMYFKKNMVMFGLGGLVLGGYVGFKIAEESGAKSKFKNLGTSTK